MFKLWRIAKLLTFLKPHEFIMASQSPTELSFSHMAELRLSPINMWWIDNEGGNSSFCNNTAGREPSVGFKVLSASNKGFYKTMLQQIPLRLNVPIIVTNTVSNIMFPIDLPPSSWQSISPCLRGTRIRDAENWSFFVPDSFLSVRGTLKGDGKDFMITDFNRQGWNFGGIFGETSDEKINFPVAFPPSGLTKANRSSMPCGTNIFKMKFNRNFVEITANEPLGRDRDFAWHLKVKKLSSGFSRAVFMRGGIHWPKNASINPNKKRLGMVTTFRKGKFLIQLFSNQDSNSSIDSTLAVEGPLLKKHVEGCLFESRTEGGRHGISEGDLLKENDISVRGQGTCM